MNRNELVKVIAGKLKKLRVSRNYSRAKMARVINAGETTYTRNEDGKTSPNLINLYNIATTFGVSLDWLICNRGEMIYKKNEKNEIVQAEPVPEPEPGEVNEELRKDIKEMLEHMEKIPLLRYKILEQFHTFKVERKAMVEEAMKT